MKCSICGVKIPNKTRDELVDMGYTFVKMGKNYFAFCPKHSHLEISEFLIKAINKMDDKDGGEDE